MNIQVENVPLQEEYNKFRKLVPNAKETVYPDGTRILTIEKDGKVLFELDYIKPGKLSEREIFVVKNNSRNPNNVKEIVEIYNSLMDEPIDMKKIEETKMSYYKFKSTDPNFLKQYIEQLKTLNPNVEISGVIINYNAYKNKSLSIVSSKPIEELNLPNVYYRNMLGTTVIKETYEEYLESMNGNFLNYSVSKDVQEEFVKVLKDCNPEVNISYIYDEKEKSGRVISSIPIEKLVMPAGYYGGIGLDKEGKIAYLNERIINLNYENDEYVEKTQKVFDSNPVNKKEFVNPNINEEKKITEEATHKFTNQTPKNEMPKKVEDNKEYLLEEQSRMAKEGRRFKILQRERAMSEEDKAKNRSAVMAGLCILGAGVSLLFNNADMHQVIQHELGSLFSWQALGQYLKDIGPLTTLLSASAAGFISKYFSHSKKLKKIQQEFIDFNASLESNQVLGGKDNAKTR